MTKIKEKKDFSYHPIQLRLSRSNLIDEDDEEDQDQDKAKSEKPIPCMIVPSPDDIDLLFKIERDHGFQKCFLIEQVYMLDIFMCQINSAARQIPRDSDKRNLINEINNAAENTLLVLNKNFLGDLVRNELNDITKFFGYPNLTFIHSIEYNIKYLHNHVIGGEISKKLGNYITEAISSSLENFLHCLKRGGLQIIFDVNNIDCSKNVNKENNLIDSIEKDLRSLIDRSEKVALGYIKKDGKPFDPLKNNFLIKLLWVYESATACPATIYWDDYHNSYKGNFYNFLKDFLPIINKFFFEKASESSTARAARKILPYYKTLPYSLEKLSKN